MRIPRFRTQRVDDSTSKTWSQFLRPSPPEWIRLAIVGLGLTLLVGGGLADHVAVTLQEGNWTVDATLLAPAASLPYRGWVDELVRRTCPEPR